MHYEIVFVVTPPPVADKFGMFVREKVEKNDITVYQHGKCFIFVKY